MNPTSINPAMSRIPFSNATVRACVLALCLTVRAFAGESSGETQPNACAGDSLAKLRRDTLDTAGENNPPGAWRVVRTVLCGSESARHRLLETNFPQRVAVRETSPGDEEGPASLVSRDAFAFPDQVVDASIVGSSGQWDVFYQPKAGCLQSFTARFTGRDWLVISSDGACG